MKKVLIILFVFLALLLLYIYGIRPLFAVKYKAVPVKAAEIALLDTENIPNYTIAVKAPQIKRERPKTPSPKACEAYREEIAKYSWNVETALRICSLESRGNPEALNDNPRTGDYSVGLMQINIYKDLAKNRPTESELKDPVMNIKTAYSLYKEYGFGTWTTF